MVRYGISKVTFDNKYWRYRECYKGGRKGNPALHFNNNKFKREHVMASVILKQDEKYNKLTMKCRMLMGQLQKVDATIVL